MGAGTGARTGTRTERRVKGRESPGTPEDIEVGRKTRESSLQPKPQESTYQRGRRIMWRTRAHGLEASGRLGEGGGGAKRRKKPQKR